MLHKNIAERTHLHIADTTELLVSEAAQYFVHMATRVLSGHDRFRVALSGGQTPKQFYQIMVHHHARSLDWSRVDFFWSDERHVPPDHADSNFRLAQEYLLEPLHIEGRQIFRVMTEEGNASYAAELYESTITTVLGPSGEFDLILLGLGEDGHTASLFPDTAALTVTDRSVVANWVGRLQTWRITFTFPLLNQARSILFLVSGEKKAKVLQEILSGALYPATRVNPQKGEVVWYADRTAASRL